MTFKYEPYGAIPSRLEGAHKKMDII